MKQGSVIVLAIIVVLLYNSVFTVDMKQQGVVLQLQEYKATVSEPGLYFKMPFVQDVTYFSKQLLVNDAEPAELITKDKKNLLIDSYSMWRIIDPLLFLQTVRSEAGGMSRLKDIIESELRVELGKHDLIDVVTLTREQIMAQVTGEVSKKRWTMVLRSLMSVSNAPTSLLKLQTLFSTACARSVNGLPRSTAPRVKRKRPRFGLKRTRKKSS